MLGSPILVRVITFDLPGSSMKLKVWFESVALSESPENLGEAFLRLVLAIELKGSSFRTFRNVFLALPGSLDLR